VDVELESFLSTIEPVRGCDFEMIFRRLDDAVVQTGLRWTYVNRPLREICEELMVEAEEDRGVWRR